MDVDAAFLRATLPARIKCLGVEMRPLCLGHYVHLRALENAFVCGQPPIIADLILGVFVCSQSFEDGQRAMRSPWLKWLFRFWGWRVRKMNIAEQIRALRTERDSFAEKMKAFGDVTSLDDVKTAEYDTIVQGKSGRRELGAPWEARLKVILMKELHLSESEVMNRPLVMSVFDYDVLSELEGGTEFFSKRDAALFSVVNSL